MGAAGAIEFIATALALSDKLIPPTINYEETDPQCDLDYVTEGVRAASLHAAQDGHVELVRLRRQ